LDAIGREDVCWHGLLGADRGWAPPKLVASSQQDARPGYNPFSASEYIDTPEVLRAKVQLLAELWTQSQNCVLYTGAGLSTAAGIGDYASKAEGSVAPHRKSAGSVNRLELSPTLAHHGLASLGQRGLVKHWIQQNHDRLAQKAGFPQAQLNEIHGAWGDDKNQVKMMDDALREDLLEWLLQWAEQADMCVALGTSLCGMNADSIAASCAQRFAAGNGQGLTIIGLQRTSYDEVSSLRIWGLCDDVILLVCKELHVKCPDPKAKSRGELWVSEHPRCLYKTPKRTSRDPL